MLRFVRDLNEHKLIFTDILVISCKEVCKFQSFLSTHARGSVFLVIITNFQNSHCSDNHGYFLLKIPVVLQTAVP